MCLEGCELSVFCSCGFVSAAMAHVFYDVVAVCCAVLVNCAVVCDALCSALLLQSALDGLEPLSLGLIKFRTWHLRIRKSMKSKSPKSPPGRTCARACGVAGPGTSPDDARENFPLQKPNEHESNSPRKARRPTRGERLRFLQPDRRRTGRPGADREWEPARNVPQPPPFRRRELLSDGSSRLGRIPRAPGDSQLDDHRLVPACQRVAAQTRIAATVATNLAWHFLLLIRALHLGTAASSS